MNSAFDLSHFDFQLAKHLIAQTPASPRDSSRLLVLQQHSSKLVDQHISDLPRLLKKGDVLVINNTKVFPARLLGKRSSGGKVEVLLLYELRPGVWACLGKALPSPQQVHTLQFGKNLTAQVMSHHQDGTYTIRFSLKGKSLWEQIEKLGSTPLPPYIKSGKDVQKIREAYQTVFAKQRGSAAAPTAGLHFTPSLIKKLKKLGVIFAPVTLHVGLGTFSPIRETDIRQHHMHSEWGQIPALSWKKIQQARKQKRRIIAVGTTALRVVEAAARDRQHLTGQWTGWISLYLKPGDKLKIVNALLTNFHLPKTTLFVLVCSLLGTRRAQQVYAMARQRGYRWASFGDAMLMLP